MSTDLRKTQELFWQLVTAPEGVEKGLDTLGLGRQSLEGVVKGDGGMSAVERLDVYANMYFFRILDALEEDYPRLLALLGEERFHNMVTGYLLVHPSSHPSLRFVGQHLSEYLRNQPSAEYQPFAADLAALEWARVDVFDAVDHEVATVETLQSIPPEDWGSLRLELIPACRLLTLDWPAHEAWSALKHGQSQPELQSATTWLRVWRRDGNIIQHEPMSELEHAALRGFARGQTLGELCTELGTGGDLEATTARIAQCLQTWLTDQIIASASVAAAAEGDREG